MISRRTIPPALASLALAAFCLFAAPAQAAISLVPTWIKSDPASKTVRLDVAADWNANNTAAGCGGNLNGYFRGSVTILIPEGWRVTIDYHVIGDKHWRSLMLTNPYDPKNLPIKLSEAEAVDGIHSRTPIEGLAPGDNDQLQFTSKSGSYWLVSAKGTDLIGGHWIRLDVKDGLKKAELQFNDDWVRRGRPAGRM
jgi:hypothetical protein